MGNESYEFVGEKDEAVRNLIAGLPRLEAPGDFDMRVRARIAAGRPAGTSWLTPLVRVAVPAALLLAIGGYLGYYALYQNVATSEPVAGVRSTDPELMSKPDGEGVVKPTDQQMSDSIAKQPANDRTDNRIDVSPNTTDPSMDGRRKSGSKVRNPGGGTYDEDLALREGHRLLPRGLDANMRRVTNVDAGGNGISPKDVFETIGVVASYTSDAWKVGSVTPNSMADKSGVKAGDIIEAINDQTLAEKTSLGRTFTSKSVRVRRDGRTIKLDLKP